MFSLFTEKSKKKLNFPKLGENLGQGGGGGAPPFKKCKGSFRTISLFHNPPKGDRREVVTLVGNFRFRELCPGHVGFWRFRSLRWFRGFVSSVFRARGGFVLSYRWLALGVGFGRPDFAAVSSYHIVGSRHVSLLDVPFGGGFV